MRRIYRFFSTRTRMCWCTLKSYYVAYRMHFILCSAFALIGLLIALSKPSERSFYNFMAAIALEQRSPVGMIFRIAGYTTLTYFLVFATSFHFVVYIFGYGGIAVGSMLIFRCGFASIAADGVWGVLYLVLFLLPVFLFNLICIILCLVKVYDFRGYSVDRRCFLNLACNSRRLMRELLYYYYASMIFTFALWLLWYLFFLLIL